MSPSIGSLHVEVRVVTVVQRYNNVSEPWLARMIAGLGSECVGVAGRSRLGGGDDGLSPPFLRLRTRSILHRILPKPLRRFSPVRPAALLEKFVHDLNADRILCHYGTVADETREAWDRIRLPLFVYFHGYDLMFDLVDQDGSGKLSHSLGYRERIVRLSERATFIANSEFSRGRLIAAGVSPDRVIVNYLGVVPSGDPPRERTGRPQILFVGRFVDCKGPDFTIQAFNLLRAQGCDAELTMVGDGPLRSKCLQMAAESPFATDIHLPGSEDHQTVKRRFEEASIFTMHSIKGPISKQEEAFGVAFLDAMSVGVPVVSGRSGGVPEIVEDGVNGFLFEPGDIQAHAERLLLLLRDRSLARNLGTAAQYSVAQKFSQQKSTEGLIRILRSS